MAVRPSDTPVSLGAFPQLPHLEVSDKHCFDATDPGEYNSGLRRPRIWRKLLITKNEYLLAAGAAVCSFGLFQAAPGGKTLTSALSSLHWRGAVQAEPYLCPS